MSGGTSNDGVLVVDKPEGPTSHDIVDRVRRALGTRKVGHAGTLDPFASGVLLICLGRATRLVRFLSGDEKAYDAVVRLGVATTTDDREGTPLGEPRDVSVDRAAVIEAARRLTGEILQVPPRFSAKHVGGRRLYEWARDGVEAERAAVAVRVDAIEVKALRGADVEIHVRCGPGTYVRALARDLGAALGVGGHLLSLRRVRSGAFSVERAIPAEHLGDAARHVLPLSALLPEMAALRVTEGGAAAVRHGRDLDRAMLESDLPVGVNRVKLLDGNGCLLALAVPRGTAPAGAPPVEPRLHPDVVLVG